ncbi:formyltransferase family protein [Kushneria aurantia]|uniref:phosphoribosylglycinamide formyltransferase 1 n=1 Tax=Kushneria aurantia TaxID=504092 RepID=A0ABV6G300_9GAMM|nr:formyltransferase family protein [Kushneria aurantia]
MIDEKILFIGDSSRWSYSAADCLAIVFRHVDRIFWDHGNEPPSAVENWEGDRLFTFKADLILTPAVLAQVKKTAINFHPSIPDYRGIGGYNYAITEHRPVFGATCHHIVKEIDFGPIIKVLRFPILPSETVDSLRDRTASYCLILFYEIVQRIACGQKLPSDCDEKWSPTLHTRAMLARHEMREGQDSHLLKFQLRRV